MQISELRMKLIENKDDSLKAFCSVTMDNEFVMRDIKIIEGTNGYFVTMPSRKMSDHRGEVRREAPSWANVATTAEGGFRKTGKKGY